MAVDVERARRLFTIDEDVRMWESGVFADDDRVELIDGEIVEMSPIGQPHGDRHEPQSLADACGRRRPARGTTIAPLALADATVPIDAIFV